MAYYALLESFYFEILLCTENPDSMYTYICICMCIHIHICTCMYEVQFVFESIFIVIPEECAQWSSPSLVVLLILHS